MTHTRSLLIAFVMVVVACSIAGAQDPPPPPPEANRQPATTESDQDQPGFVQKAKRWAEETQLAERLSGDIDGWYPRVGGMTRGSGFSIGPGYRFHVGDVLLDVSAGYSIRNYKAVDAKVRWVSAFDDRIELWTNYRFEDFPQEDFFGMGPESLRDARTSYDFDSNDVSVRGLFKARPWLTLGTTVGYMSPSIGPGADDHYPSIEEAFTDADAPGLAAQPNFLHTTFFVDVDYRDAPGNPRSGGLYRAGFGIWDDRTLQQYDFRRFDLDLLQFVPLVPAKTHVLLGHFGVSYVNNEPGHRVPFYFLPYVGGVDTVRSFHEFRFKDENAVWMSAEYRWVPIKYLSLAAFIDAGKVAAHHEDIDTGDLKKGYGFGFRIHTRTQTFARVDFATGGGEGWKVFLKLGPRL